MPTEQEREEITRQLQKLLDEIEADLGTPYLIRAKASIAIGLVRKLAAPKKGDGDAA